MKKGYLTGVLTQIGDSMRKHSPEILTGAGVLGMVSTVVLAVKATPKALNLIEKEKERQKVEKLKKTDVVKTVWKCYIPTTISGMLSIICVVVSGKINNKRNAALTAAYSLSESALKLYQEKVIETIGEKEEQKIRDSVAEEKIRRNPPIPDQVIITDAGNTLCLEVLSGRYFKSNIETIRKAVNELNGRMVREMTVTLNDYYEAIGLQSTKTGDNLGWNVNKGLIDLAFTSQLDPNGTPCLVIDHRELPTYDYE